MRCRVRQTRYHLSVAIVVGLSLLSTVGAETSSPVWHSCCVLSAGVLRLVLSVVADSFYLQEADCAEREVKGGCLPRHRLHHLLHHHEYSGRNVNVVEVSSSGFGLASNKLKRFAHAKLESESFTISKAVASATYFDKATTLLIGVCLCCSTWRCYMPTSLGQKLWTVN